MQDIVDDPLPLLTILQRVSSLDTDTSSEKLSTKKLTSFGIYEVNQVITLLTKKLSKLLTVRSQLIYQLITWHM